MKQPARAPQGKTKAPKDKRKSREDMNQKSRDQKQDKKHRGNASGSRANPVAQNQNKATDSQPKDPRIGSKKPIPLGNDAAAAKPASAKPVKEKKVKETAEKQPKLSPQEELTQLENSERLDGLLDRLENGETLPAEEQAWLDLTLDRIDVLMEQLGIELGDDDDGDEAQEDMYRLLKGGN
ncbi:Der GTPase-activating protein YihI [Erwiniaceae bacterium BAC15a-03b]|uniref:Der GTPase-activating protein YihI n=1 Tax=Winslowiella arboricola TaxID=2978220 RepID=A0A9J6PLJ0_9GAMM|nr:Der GTPase-activating protein YihI [Winslowiella arboricola]MCU5773475.1 Der GTPase-activating protein YihI [Winslowiella arboricola]MCU5776613.1 Der GTPase-activating protein YihI [Winslowiella arboricola]